MRHSTLTTALSATLLVACAHGREEMRATTVTGETTSSTMEAEREVIAVDTTPPPESAPAARPRLSQTVTLGQGTESQYTPSPPPPTVGTGSTNQNVVVNNNIVVQQPAFGVFGGGGYVGYGGYGGVGGYGRATSFYNDGRGGSRAGNAWGATGWEGARRTAAPGQTPGVGGNWSPAPSYGPATMK